MVFRWSWLKYYRLTTILINLIIPCFIQLLATIFLLHKSTRLKQNLAKKQERNNYLKYFKKQLPLYGSPFALIALSMIRLIFSLTLACITRPEEKYIYLMAYFISFIPWMGTFLIFVLPAKIYRDEFNNVLKQIKQKLKIKN